MTERIAWPEQKDTGYIRIKRKDIHTYMTDDLFRAVELYARIKRYGWPQGRGYLAEPRAVFSLVTLFDGEKDNYQSFTRKKE